MTKKYWSGKKVLVTGGTGFVGNRVVEKLLERGAEVSVLDNFQNGNESNLAKISKSIEIIRGDCRNDHDAFLACKNKEIVMNLAARVEGIEFNKTHPATMMQENLLIGTVMIEAAKKAGVERFLVVSSACVYPGTCSVPTPEDEGFLEVPEAANGGYGWAKRMNEKIGEYYAQEYGMKVGIVRPYNCYGPRDHFQPVPTHVVPSLIKRVMDGENPVVVWGSGNQTRAFLYVDDLAQGMIAAIEKYPVPDAINLGSDEEVSMKELIEKIIKVSGKKSPIVFDTSKPDGSPRRNSNNTKAKEKIGFVAKTSLEDGLAKTLSWYKETYL